MAGYSPNPLIKKLGIKPGFRVIHMMEPRGYFKLLGKLPEGVEKVENPEPESVDYIHLFAKDMETLEAEILPAKHFLKKEGMLWISWPKGTSGVETDLNSNIVRGTGLNSGLVDIKVCAIDDTWSALKFVYRTKDR